MSPKARTYLAKFARALFDQRSNGLLGPRLTCGRKVYKPGLTSGQTVCSTLHHHNQDTTDECSTGRESCSASYKRRGQYLRCHFCMKRFRCKSKSQAQHHLRLRYIPHLARLATRHAAEGHRSHSCHVSHLPGSQAQPTRTAHNPSPATARQPAKWPGPPANGPARRRYGAHYWGGAGLRGT